MNEQDKAHARRAIEEKKLSIEQVEEIRAEVDRTGRPFLDVARSRGLLSAPPPPKRAEIPPSPRGLVWQGLRELQNSTRFTPLYAALMAASFLIFSGLLILTVVKMRERTSKDEDLALETEKNTSESDRKAADARRGYNRSLVAAKESEAQAQLAKARAAMARVDTMLNSGTLPPELTVSLNEAFVAYNGYLRVFPDDAVVCIERARTHEIRRNYDLAIADLEHAISLQPNLEPALRDRIAKARQMLARTPK
jgi:tetratricopeptide (TPR) repeat protein